MKKLSYLLISLATLLLMGSCEKGFLNVNTNPNSPTAVNAGVVLSNDLYQMASAYSTGLSQFLGFWMGYWSRSGNYIPDNATETYEISPGYSYSETFWQTMYHINLDLNYVQKQAIKDKDPFFEGVSKILMSCNYARLVDVYNDIPYTQALDISNISPKYDDAATVYKDLFSQVDSGIALIQTASGSNYTSTLAADAPFDIMFGGNTSEWMQFANTLELKMLLNLSQDASMSSFISSQIAKITADGAGFMMAGTSALVNPGYINTNGKQNPFYGFYGFTATGTPAGQNAYFRANNYAVTFSTVTNDPRLSFFFAPTSSAFSSNTDTVSGNNQGDPNALSNSNTSGFGPGLLGTATSSTPVLPDFESLFLQSEAALRGWIPGDPQQFYQQAIAQSFAYEGVSGNDSANAATYYSQNMKDVEWPSGGTFNDKLETIIKQKWVALDGVDILEAWNDYRRLDLPADVPLSSNPHLTMKQIPVRLLYPQTEIDRNPNNVPAGGKGTNAQFTGKIFWMP
ncbi:MAG: SusD/RagB family nutrient-binding outer membrane lipoprotein [Chitinophagaceae bacterium]|nr:MAG: SusD/RagB family nutrient-binding outer membrane lipoprotein [Chitinophagaceae bacterium]